MSYFKCIGCGAKANTFANPETGEVAPVNCPNPRCENFDAFITGAESFIYVTNV
ncbi:hypothetical protein ACF07D_04720 [Leucobacter sp. NPDC015123]|uniref:hypothetical protein n=1 Tax=Leucobacter sp. NPDC015123 TaxID=3364129 RepID=UPI0036F45757